MKDPTRGGTAAALNEIASKSGLEFSIEENQIPIKQAVRSLCDILGLDPLHMSCEGVAIMAVDSAKTDRILKALGTHKATKDARVIGHVRDGKSRVVMTTNIGGTKVVQVPYGEPVPRVC